MYIGHRKEFQSWCFGRDGGLMLETSALKLLTEPNLHYQLSWWNQIILLYSSTDAAPQFLYKLTPFIRMFVIS